MPVIPVVNKDITMLTKDFQDKINEPKQQRNLVLIIVCIALLLDNMLYMVIVPIIPEHLHKIDQANAAAERIKYSHAIQYDGSILTSTLLTTIQTTTRDDEVQPFNGGGRGARTKLGSLSLVTKSIAQQKIDSDKEEAEDIRVGFLFASKAMVQLLVNPFSGAFIDRVGYDIPMCIGLTIIFFSTMAFSFGNTYNMLFFARSLQGVGSAFADTSGLAMIADRFTEDNERSKALGIALAFISFGSLVAPPFGGFLYQYTDERVPFISLALLALFDGFMLVLVMRPHRIAMQLSAVQDDKPKGTPIWKLLMDPYIAVCAGALIMANVSLAFLEPTIAIWMKKEMNATESQIGFVWLPGFIPHIGGVYFTVWMSREYPQHQWLLAMSGLALEGVSCFMIPFCTNYWAIMIPISGICFGIALVDTAILPTLGYLVDVRHTSVYGSIYAIADISYSLAYAVGPVIAGNLLHSFGFSFLNFGICFSNLLYAPVIYFLRYFYEFKPLESNELNALSNQQSTIGGAGFKRFTNDDSEFDQPIQHGFGGNPSYSGNNNNNPNEYSSMENPGFNNGGYYNGQMNGQQQQQQFHQQQRPDSAQFQGMQKYPKKATKNPYKDTKNLIDNMDEDDY